MKYRQKDILASSGLRAFLFLLIIYFSQIYPYYHLHHTHTDDALEFEISSHPIDIDTEHPSDHDHDDDESDHPNDHQHTIDKPIDWLNAQSQRNLQIENHLFITSTAYLKVENHKSTDIESEQLIYVGNNYFSPNLTRGPPYLS